MQLLTWGPCTYPLTFCVPPSPSRQITSEQDPRCQPGAASKARFPRALNPKHNQIISTAQPRLSCPRPEIQITTSSSSSSWRSGKPDTKSSLLKTRRLHCSSHEGLSAGAAPAGPAAASGILSSAAASGWADQALLALHTGAAETALPGPA